jgi:hypothetical protein
MVLIASVAGIVKTDVLDPLLLILGASSFLLFIVAVSIWLEVRKMDDGREDSS